MENFEDLRQSEEYARYYEKLGWKIEELKTQNSKVKIFIRSFGPVGIAKIQRANVKNWEEVNRVLRANGVVITRYEPLTDNPTWRRADPMLATKTLKINLHKIQMKSDARYCLRKSQALNPKFHINDFDGFYEMWKQANKVKGLWTPGERNYKALVENFGKKCFCITFDNLAGALILMHDKIAYYYYAGSLPEGKKMNLPYLVVWECMKEAKKRRCDWWDFEGIFDVRFPNKSIMGYSHFKKSFGGEEILYPGSFTRWF